MIRGRIVVAGVLLGLGFVFLATPAQALITRLLPLKELVEESPIILTATVESVDADKPSMVLTVDEQLKGRMPFKKMVVLLKGDTEAAKGKQTPDLLKRVGPKLSLVMLASKPDTTYVVNAYTNGTWFQMIGVKDEDSDAVHWSFTHLEPYLRRTYKGPTADLQKAIADYLSDKKKLPEVDAKEKPGLGPEFEAEKKETKPEDLTRNESRSIVDRPPFRGTVTTGPVFGVIPAVLIGGPLALLAMLFPTVFGGWKRWLTLLSVACTNSTLYSLQYWFSNELSGTVWGRSSTLWVAMALVTLAGTVWAFQRHCTRALEGEAPFQPNGVELIVLSLVSAVGLGIVVYAKFNRQSLLSPDWMPMLPYCVSAWGALLYVLYAYLIPRRLPALATEAVMLAIMAFATIGLMTVGQRSGGEVGGPSAAEVRPRLVWTFTAPGKGDIASTPVVVGERIYLGIAHPFVYNPYGALYCLDRATGKEVWHFDNKKKMRQVYSTPCLVDGKLYIGEGFHEDKDCKFYCLNADTGELIWEFETTSHTESSPCVVNGKVYCGAGDDGLYCLDAATGNKLWNFPGYHIDASPAVSGKFVYAGAGVGDLYTEPAILCLNAETGAQEWLIKTKLPVWGSPTVVDDLVYFGVGNGRLNESAEKNPAGELLCVRAKDGSPAWRFEAQDSVLCRPTVDAYQVYFGSRDQKVYCTNRKTGKPCWHYDLGSPVVTSPALVPCPCSDRTWRIDALGTGGQLASLDAATGRVVWTLNLIDEASSPLELFSPPVRDPTPDPGGLRRFYVGATILASARTAVLYCYEETTPTAKE